MGTDSKYLAELISIQRWIKATAGLNSFRLKEAPPQLPRPVVLWEAPTRTKARNVGRWAYANKVTQFGKLYVVSVDQLAVMQEQLITDLEDRAGRLPLYNAAGIVVAQLKGCELTFNTTEGLNIPFNLKYEITYSRARPAEAPHAIFVGTKIQGGSGIVRDYNLAEHNT